MIKKKETIFFSNNFTTGKQQSGMTRENANTLIVLDDMFPGCLGDRTDLKRLDTIFGAFETEANKPDAPDFNIPDFKVVQGQIGVKEKPLEYDYSDAIWLGKWRIEEIKKKKILGRSVWKELKLVLALDGLVLLPFGFTPKSKDARHRSIFDSIKKDDIQKFIPSIFMFIRSWFGANKFVSYIGVSSSGQQVDIESYCVEHGILLTINYEVGMPQKNFPDDWLESLE